MTNTPGMFWSGETLSKRLSALIKPFAPDRVDCAAYRLSVGPEVYVSPNDQSPDPTTVTVCKLATGDAFTMGIIYKVPEMAWAVQLRVVAFRSDESYVLQGPAMNRTVHASFECIAPTVWHGTSSEYGA